MTTLKISVLVENSTFKPGFLAEHGLALLIEVTGEEERKLILFDTGQTSDTLLHNMEKLGIQPPSLDLVILSHGHYDHTGGLPGLVGKTKKLIVFSHPSALKPKLDLSEEGVREVGVPFNPWELGRKGVVFVPVKEKLRLLKGVWLTGEIPRKTDYEEIPSSYYTVEGETLKRDLLLDDQALVIETEKGLIVVTGCCHSGLVNTLTYVKGLFHGEQIYGVIGGFHMVNASDKRVKETIKELTELNPLVIVPMHCTGLKFHVELLRVFGRERVKELHAGDTLRLGV